MFVVLLSYVKPLEEVDALLSAHARYLDEQYEAGVFVASGRKIPRTGGVILDGGIEQDALLRILEKDPFKVAGVGDYEVVEFQPSRMQPGFEGFA
jgi:uncharacterized protein YciI